MRKNDKKGFILAETIAISVVVMVSLIIVYTQFVYVGKSYSRIFTYNSVNNLYLANNIKNFIIKDGLDNLIKGLNENDYVDFTSCSTDYFNEYIYCETLLSELGVKQVIFTRSNLSDLKNNMDNGLSEKMKQFINYMNYKDTNNYRIIVEFNDETYATLSVDGASIPVGEGLISILLKQYKSSNITGLLKDSINPKLYYY